VAQADLWYVTDFSTFQETYEPDPPMMAWPFGLQVQYNRQLWAFDHGEVYEETGGRRVTLTNSCAYSGCALNVQPTGSRDYAHPTTRTFEVVLYTDRNEPYGNRTLVVNERRLHFALEGDFDSSPGAFHVAVSMALGNVDLDTIIYENGSPVRRCSVYFSSCDTSVTNGDSYYATVEDSSGNLYGITPSYRATSSTTGVKETADQIDLPRLGLLYATTSDVCDTLLTFPYGSHLENESPTDQWIACDTAVTNRLSMTALLQAVAVAGTGTTGVLWWLEHQGTVQQLSLPTIPWQDTEVPPIDALPQVWQGAVINLADYFKTQARGRDWPQATAEAVAAACLWNASRASLDGLETCRSLPIFITGADAAEATEHDIEAIAWNPGWVKLNYEYGRGKEAYQDRDWYTSESACQASHDADEQCDEYPFWASEQGGPAGVPTPRLRYIDEDDNQWQGSRYGSFTLSCRLVSGDPPESGNASGGTAFLVIPVPVVPTDWLCNR
jgi:hypothetical protein